MYFDFCTVETPNSINVLGVFKQISAAFEKEPHLLQVPAVELTKSFNQGLSVIVMLGDRPVGHEERFQATQCPFRMPLSMPDWLRTNGPSF